MCLVTLCYWPCCTKLSATKILPCARASNAGLHIPCKDGSSRLSKVPNQDCPVCGKPHEAWASECNDADTSVEAEAQAVVELPASTWEKKSGAPGTCTVAHELAGSGPQTSDPVAMKRAPDINIAELEGDSSFGQAIMVETPEGSDSDRGSSSTISGFESESSDASGCSTRSQGDKFVS